MSVYIGFYKSDLGQSIIRHLTPLIGFDKFRLSSAQRKITDPQMEMVFWEIITSDRSKDTLSASLLTDLETKVSAQIANNPKANNFNKFSKIWNLFFKEFSKDLVASHAIANLSNLGTIKEIEVEDDMRIQKGKDEALLILWAEASSHMPNCPKLKEPAEIRIWLNNPANAQSMRLVKNLYLGGKGLKIIPEEIQKFTKLICLYLDNNKIVSIPENFHLPKLIRLRLEYNKITSLPTNLNLPMLEELALLDNQLKSVSANFTGLPILKVLILNGNKLTSFPASFNLPNLQQLSLGRNQIRALPANIIGLEKLQKLHLGRNQISALPANMTGLEKLQELDLDNNQISALPENLNLPNLYLLLLRYNNITSLPSTLKLQLPPELYLEHNKMAFLPKDIPRLIRLNLDGNPVLFLHTDIASKVYGPFEKVLINSKLECDYKPNSPLGKLYRKMIVLDGDLVEGQKCFDDLSQKDKNLVYRMVYFVAKDLGLNPDKDNDPIWGQNHIWDDRDIFMRAIHRAIGTNKVQAIVCMPCLADAIDAAQGVTVKGI